MIWRYSNFAYKKFQRKFQERSIDRAYLIGLVLTENIRRRGIRITELARVNKIVVNLPRNIVLFEAEKRGLAKNDRESAIIVILVGVIRLASPPWGHSKPPPPPLSLPLKSRARRVVATPFDVAEGQLSILEPSLLSPPSLPLLPDETASGEARVGDRECYGGFIPLPFIEPSLFPSIPSKNPFVLAFFSRLPHLFRMARNNTRFFFFLAHFEKGREKENERFKVR